MLTQQQKDLLILLARQKGYLGCTKKGKLAFSSGVESNSYHVIKRLLGFPEYFKTVSEPELMPTASYLYMNYSLIESEILVCLSEIKIAEGIVNTSNTVGSAAQSDSYYDRLEIYKTLVRGANIFDEGCHKSNGFSIILLNPENRKIIDSRTLSIDGVLKLRGIDRSQVADDGRIKLVIPKFNPRVPDLVVQAVDSILGTNEHVAHLNTAVPPDWMKSEYAHVKPNYGGFIKKLIDSLFPNSKERERVLDWCHHAIVEKNETALCLVGPRGTGKSTFATIMSHIVGKRYSDIVGEAILTDKFNSQFINKRMIIFEEVALTEREYVNKVKSWCNSYLSVEQKGKDSFTAENFTSMIFIANDKGSFAMTPQERRFSIPEMSKRFPREIFEPGEVGKYKTAFDRDVIEDEEVMEDLAAFGKFLLNREPKHKNIDALKEDYYFEICEMSMSEWEMHLRNTIMEKGIIGEAIHIDKLRLPDVDGKSKSPTKRSTYSAFLGDYLHRDKCRIGEVVDFTPPPAAANPLGRETSRGRKRTYAVLPNPEFLELFGNNYKDGKDLL